jgi:hypothetical protein
MSYIISIEPSTHPGKALATSSDGGSVYTSTPLLTGARYWLNHGANPDATITTIWSSGNTDWSLRSTIGHAAKLTVEDNSLGKPVFRRYRDRRQTSGIAPYNS